MKGISSKDGKMHGNVQMVSRYEESQARKGKSADHSGEETGPDGHEEIKAVVAEHGPAHKHTIHRHEMGGFGSTTEHEDGHVHEHPVPHESLEEAHEHGAHAMGEHADMTEEGAEGAEDKASDEMPMHKFGR